MKKWHLLEEQLRQYYFDSTDIGYGIFAGSAIW